MEYVYAAMLLHAAKQEINEANVTKTLEAAGVKADASRVKALIASLADVNIEEAIEKASVPVAAAAPAASASGEAKKEVVKEEEGKTEEEAAQGLAGLFG